MWHKPVIVRQIHAFRRDVGELDAAAVLRFARGWLWCAWDHCLEGIEIEAIGSLG